MNLDVKLTENSEQSNLVVSGEIDAYTAPRLKETFSSLLEQENQKVVVDLEKVTYMDSTGLGVFIGALKMAKEKNSQLRLVNIQDRVYRLFQITGLDEIMDLKVVMQGGNES